MTRFAFGSDYTVGIEEELLLVDAASLQLSPVAGAVLGAMDVSPSAAGHEAYAAQIELRSPPSTSAVEASAALAGLRARAAAAGATLLGGGLHPTGGMGDAELVPASRYERVADEMRGLLRRTPESALHVHVGLPDERAAIRAFNGLRAHLPVLQGLSASSPWWFGVDSGLASARYALTRSYPGRGIPPPLNDLEELEELTAETIVAAGVPEATFLWWDLRLHPTYGTVEVRELDAQARLEDGAALAALVRALAVEAQDRLPERDVPTEVLAWSSFRASRDGTDATILDDGALRPLSDLARRLATRVRPVARALGDEDALDGVGRIVREGGGASRQRQAFIRGGVRGILELLVEETRHSSAPSRPTELPTFGVE